MILARGGSKRVPKKNIQLLAGKPLVAYTIETAVRSKCFEDIIISTDDAEVVKIGNDYDVLIDDRPNDLCLDNAKAVEVVYEYVKRVGISKKYDHIAMMLPTCPFRATDDVKCAMKIFTESDDDIPLVTVSQYDFPPQLSLRGCNDKNKLEMVSPNDYKANTRSQNIETLYHPNGAVYISSINRYLKHGTFFSQQMLYYEMPLDRSYDIDYPFQLKVAQVMAENGLDN